MTKAQIKRVFECSRTTINDYIKYCENLLNEGVFSPKTLKALTKMQNEYKQLKKELKNGEKE